MNGLPVGDRQIRVSMAKTGLSQPSGPSSPAPLPPYEMLQAQAQAHMMNGSGYMMQPNMGPMQPNLGPMPGMPPGMMPLPPMPPPGPKPHRRPHQDPTKVHRTVYLENVAADIDEQVRRAARNTYNLHILVCIAVAPPAPVKQKLYKMIQRCPVPSDSMLVQAQGSESCPGLFISCLARMICPRGMSGLESAASPLHLSCSFAS